MGTCVPEFRCYTECNNWEQRKIKKITEIHSISPTRELCSLTPETLERVESERRKQGCNINWMR